MGTTELMIALTMDPEGTHKLLKKITGFHLRLVNLAEGMFPIN